MEIIEENRCIMNGISTEIDPSLSYRIKINQSELIKDNDMLISLFKLVIIWFLSFLFILVLFLKIDNLRSYVIKDLIPIKELDELERKAQRIIQYQVKHDNMKIQHTYEEVKFEKTLNESLNKILSSIILEPIKIENTNTCKPESNIVFIKTHKTASSTVTNILNRYADLKELLVAVPAMGDVRFSWPRRFHWSSVDLTRLDGQPANILTNHARYNRAEMNMIMEDDTKYITILRNPITQFESSFYYFEFDRILRLKGSKNPIEEFLKFPDEHLYNLTLILGDLPDTINLIQSGMFYDLGYDFIDIEFDDVINNILHKLDTEFQLVLIMEYFDESLVLLMREFCLNINDIFYIKQNQRTKHINISSEAKQRIKQWNHADVMLYEHFNKTFWTKITNHGPSFWDDVREFKIRNKEFEKVCSPSKLTMKGFKINVDVSTFVMNPKVDRYNRYLCEKVLMTEVDYLAYFRNKFRNNFGYQKLLVEEGLKPAVKSRRLQQKLKSAARKNPKFSPLKGFEKKR